MRVIQKRSKEDVGLSIMSCRLILENTWRTASVCHAKDGMFSHNPMLTVSLSTTLRDMCLVVMRWLVTILTQTTLLIHAAAVLRITIRSTVVVTHQAAASA